MTKPLLVTEPFLPPIDEYIELLEKIWERKWLTNQGPFHQQLEAELCSLLNVPYISLFSNGTLALIASLKHFEIQGEVITTPFSFVATTHAIRWAGASPVFADIDSEYFNLDPLQVEKAITDKTSAILAVHVYGNPCQVEELERIARKHNLKLIFDAAHAFAVRKKDKSILLYGDLSVLSFHATKVFTTIEGGAIVSHNKEEKEKIDQLKNFGFVNEKTILLEGFNAKMNEFQAAFGLVQLKYLSSLIEKRKILTELYRNGLRDIDGIKFLTDQPGIVHNYAYFPILINEEITGKSAAFIYEEFKKYNIFTRRYFYPLISNLPMYRHLASAHPSNLPIANYVSERILCLPLSANYTPSQIEYVIDSLKRIIS
ncbi:MAG: DegT/DnrJ/EryC1/StrS family aminotransferase [Bacteroidales bacterium]|nr:DegT/DnrJ/EryC1/StrS family aminotransferase [Bacteroidales bacterium]